MCIRGEQFAARSRHVRGLQSGRRRPRGRAGRLPAPAGPAQVRLLAHPPLAARPRGPPRSWTQFTAPRRPA